MHPRIKYLFSLLKPMKPYEALNVEVLYFLKVHDATKTEASITLFSCFNLDGEVVDNFINDAEVWEPEDPNETLYQVLKYEYYNPDDPNYRADDDSVGVSF